MTGRMRFPRPHWGWKEPNTHIFLDRLAIAFPHMRYIHVMRNGLDMAHSSNQNQLRLWGSSLLGTAKYEVNPHWSLKYWCAVHRRVTALGRSMGDRFLLLNYDELCRNPEAGLKTLGEFVAPSNPLSTDDLATLVRSPDSVGRFKEFGLDVFDGDDVDYARSLGFDTRCD